MILLVTRDSQGKQVEHTLFNSVAQLTEDLVRSASDAYARTVLSGLLSDGRVCIANGRDWDTYVIA